VRVSGENGVDEDDRKGGVGVLLLTPKKKKKQMFPPPSEERGRIKDCRKTGELLWRKEKSKTGAGGSQLQGEEKK